MSVCPHTQDHRRVLGIPPVFPADYDASRPVAGTGGGGVAGITPPCPHAVFSEALVALLTSVYVFSSALSFAVLVGPSSSLSPPP